MSLQFKTRHKFFRTIFTLCRIYAVYCSLMVVVVDQLTKLFITHVAIAEDAVLLMTLQMVMTWKFFTAGVTLCWMYVVHRSLMVVQLLYSTNVDATDIAMFPMSFESFSPIKYFVAVLALMLHLLRSRFHLL